MGELERQRSKHIQWASDVMGGNSLLSIQNSEDVDDDKTRSPLPLGKLLKSSSGRDSSVGTNIGDDEDANLRRDQFLQRIEYYILNVLKSILFCCRYEIMDNWNHKRIATHLFAADLRQQHFLSASEESKPSLSVLFRLSHYAITHLKGLYQTQLNEESDEQSHGILRTHNLKNNNRQKRRDSMYDSKKVETEGVYHIVTRKNIEKSLWILFEHCYIDL